MSNYRRQPLEISGGDQGGWVVHFGPKAVPVSSRDDARLLADLPVELYRAVSKELEPDVNKIARILDLCDEYHLDRRFQGVRQLRSWFKQNGR